MDEGTDLPLDNGKSRAWARGSIRPSATICGDARREAEPVRPLAARRPKIPDVDSQATAILVDMNFERSPSQGCAACHTHEDMRQFSTSEKGVARELREDRFYLRDASPPDGSWTQRGRRAGAAISASLGASCAQEATAATRTLAAGPMLARTISSVGRYTRKASGQLGS